MARKTPLKTGLKIALKADLKTELKTELKTIRIANVNARFIQRRSDSDSLDIN